MTLVWHFQTSIRSLERKCENGTRPPSRSHTRKEYPSSVNAILQYWGYTPHKANPPWSALKLQPSHAGRIPFPQLERKMCKCLGYTSRKLKRSYNCSGQSHSTRPSPQDTTRTGIVVPPILWGRSRSFSPTKRLLYIHPGVRKSDPWIHPSLSWICWWKWQRAWESHLSETPVSSSLRVVQESPYYDQRGKQRD